MYLKKKTICSLKCSPEKVEWNFHNSAEKFFVKTPEFYRSQPKIINKPIKFPEKVFSPTMFFRNSRMQFWQPCRKRLRQDWQTLAQTARTYVNYNVFQNKFLKRIFYKKNNAVFTISPKKICYQEQNLKRTKQENIFRILFPLKLIL